MDGKHEKRATRASKRRRLSPPSNASPHPTRSTSPDELASTPHTPLVISRRGSNHSHPTGAQISGQAPLPSSEPRRPSFSPVSDSPSADELDHTASEEFHTFYRNNQSYRPASFSNRDGANFQEDTRPPSPPTPAYSRISTPMRSPSVQSERERERKDPVFRPYRCKTVLRGNKKGVSMVKFSHDGRFVASAGE